MEITRFLASSTFSCNILKTAKLPEHLQKSNSLWPNSHSNIFLTFISTNQVKEHMKHPMKSAKHLTCDPLNPPFSPPWPQPMAQRTRREALAPHRGWRGSAVRKTQLEGIGKFGCAMTYMERILYTFVIHIYIYIIYMYIYIYTYLICIYIYGVYTS